MTAKNATFSGLILIALAFPSALLAATNCDSQAKPAFDCPPGYSMSCIPVGGDHWGCGKAGLDGLINEAPPMNQAPSAAPAANTAPAPVAAPAPQPSAKPAAPKPAPAKQPALSAAPEPAASAAADATTAPVQAVGTQATSEGSNKIPYVLYLLVILVFAALAAWFRRWLEIVKKAGAGGTKAEEKKPCPRCGGKGTVTETHTVTVKCTHCKGTGNDPCHHCGGTGKMSLPNPPADAAELENWPPCDFCGGSGKSRAGAGHDFGAANEALAVGFGCCMCHGRKTESYTETSEVPCPVCKGKK